MFNVLVQMAVLIVCGSAWRFWQPGELDADTVRKALTNLVYYLFLPALVLNVLWHASLGMDTLRISVVAASSVLVGMMLGYFVCRALNLNRAVTGALLLASAFPNVMYLGLPVLDATLGHWARSVAVQYDYFACTPLVFTLGIFVAKYYGVDTEKADATRMSWLEILKVPPVWAAILAIILNQASINTPLIVGEVLDLLSAAVVPLMLIALGMSLKWNKLWLSDLRLILPICFIQVLIIPMYAWFIAQSVGITDELLIAVVLEAAMPSMVLGIVFCDRFGLNTSIYAETVTLSTLLSLFTLPLWFNWMQNSLHVFFGG